ncbi:MAG: acyl-CoA dehydratase activase, partial [Oscillospiraceae bacterium]
MRIGLDIGSTTIKCVVLDDKDQIVYSSYQRHFSQITEMTLEVLKYLANDVLHGENAGLVISGSAGMGMAEGCEIPFVQEVYATRIAANKLMPGTDVIIELGGEDAKILFLEGGMEVRMNGSCAGGTGAFIDQMATLLNVTPDDMNDLATQHEKIYTIASRCGVFAKTDIQPLINQGARKTDISASIFYAVVNQTIAGLAQGRPIKGKLLYLGGPLTFLSELRASFDKTLGLKGICPENSLYYVSLGAAYTAKADVDINAAVVRLESYKSVSGYNFIKPLFADEADYKEFSDRHAKASVKKMPLADYIGDVYVGIDAGSTTVKAAIISADGMLLDSTYQSNSGNPVPKIREYLLNIYENYPDINILSSAVTGYGEEIIQNAFGIDHGVVETIAHFTAAKAFMPTVDFVIDIGGQDIKCFKIANGAVDNIFLNEACSSGCGSFLQTFAAALGCDIADFAKKGLFADKPVDLGSRCTVFMNSSVKQAQKDGASTENISAGLSISVVKNAIYKVIRPASPKDLGKNIVVQGGTFYNDAVLRAFEQELGLEVIRPDISGLMGAYGAALWAKGINDKKPTISTILSKEQLENFVHNVKVVNCGGCPNNCRLTVNDFAGGRKFISGNRCERPVTKKAQDNSFNMYDYKRKLLETYAPVKAALRGKIGLPMGLNMYELLPFWHTFFTMLGFEVVTSGSSDRKLYLAGQATIPSDTVCFPAKLMHGHTQKLISDGVKTIFYPCMSYNFDEGLGDNHYNCPVVAYYPEVLDANMPMLSDVNYIHDFVGIHREKDFPKKVYEILKKSFANLRLAEVKQASKMAYAEQRSYMVKIREKGEEIIETARQNNMPIIVLAGRPYHIDPEIGHGVDSLICNFGAAVISEDVISDRVDKFDVKVLNQWTYHSRLYAAAKY